MDTTQRELASTDALLRELRRSRALWACLALALLTFICTAFWLQSTAPSPSLIAPACITVPAAPHPNKGGK